MRLHEDTLPFLRELTVNNNRPWFNDHKDRWLAIKEQFEAFYSQVLEPLVIKFSQAFTQKMFTPRERGFGNKIEFYTEDLVFLTMSQRIEMIKDLSPTGALFENEKRRALGLKPLPELEGKRYMSLNWIDADKANQYQVGNVDVVDEIKEDM